MEIVDYFVLILVVLAYAGWFLAREKETHSAVTRRPDNLSPDTQPRG
jgi:hypothetical protein